MTKSELIQEIEQLVQKVRDLKFDDYFSAMKVIKDFENFASKYQKYLNPYILEHIETTTMFFKNMNMKKNIKDKEIAWQTGCNDLILDISSMESENSFPDEIQ